MNFNVLPGKLLVSRDPDETFKDFVTPQGIVHRLYFPDDMASSGVDTWAASDRMRPSGICHLHSPSWGWYSDPVLTGMRVYFEKWSERTFEYEGRTFCVIDERAISAYEPSEETE